MFIILRQTREEHATFCEYRHAVIEAKFAAALACRLAIPILVGGFRGSSARLERGVI